MAPARHWNLWYSQTVTIASSELTWLQHLCSWAVQEQQRQVCVKEGEEAAVPRLQVGCLLTS